MIKKIALSITISLLPMVAAQAVSNSFDISLYKQLADAARDGDKQADTTLEVSFSLMMDTAMYTNESALIHTHQGIDGKAAFCLPHKVEFTGPILRAYTDSYLQEHKSLSGDTPLALVSVLAITDRYPCK